MRGSKRNVTGISNEYTESKEIQLLAPVYMVERV